MTTTILLTMGDETAVAIPPNMLAELGLSAGSVVELHVSRGTLIVEPSPRKRPRYKLEDLMAQCDLSRPMSDEEREWLDAPDVGNERIP